MNLVVKFHRNHLSRIEGDWSKSSFRIRLTYIYIDDIVWCIRLKHDLTLGVKGCEN
jgi:hypothetical protein